MLTGSWVAYGGADGGTIAVAGVVVARVELVHDERGALPADVLDLGKLGVGNDTPGWVPGVGSQDNAGAAGDFLGDLFGVDVVAVFLGQGDRDGGELQGNKSVSGDFPRSWGPTCVFEEGKHLIVGCLVVSLVHLLDIQDMPV